MRKAELQSLLDPCSVSTFFERYFGQSFLYIPGEPSKFAELFSWSGLNDILRHHRFPNPSQVGIHKEGQRIPREAYITPEGELQATEVNDLLRNGATLIVNAIDAMWEPITALSQGLESALQSRIQVNMYAAWGLSRGFDLHFDDHDVFVLQVAGRKHWEIHGPSAKSPTPLQPGDARPPDQGPIWQAWLNAGDVLYIPRGWWHFAKPCGESTLHLTFGFNNPTARDLLRWLTGQLSTNECMTVDIPRFADSEAKERYVTGVRETVTKALADPGVLDAFSRHLRITAKSRPEFGLPWSVSPQSIPESGGCIIHVIPSVLDIQDFPDQGNTAVFFNNRTVLLKSSLHRVIKFVIAHAPLSIDEIYRRLEPEVTRPVIKELLSDLVKHGIISVKAP